MTTDGSQISRQRQVTPMVYLEQAPSPILRSWIRSLWYCRAPAIAHRRERVLPNGCMQVILNLSRDYLTGCGEDGVATGRLPPAIIVGARARYEVVDTSDMEELAGIVIQPGGFARLFRERADLLFERSIALDDIWRTPRLIEALREAPAPAGTLRVLDAVLQKLVPEGARRSELVDHAIHLFRTKGLSVASCARSVGVSDRRLSQVFREEVGMAPKTWTRLRRFQAAVRALHNKVDIPWATLALECGYYDQSHFANDFRAFSGIDPTTYSAQRGPWQNHVAIF
jgi:AraC-like DNA-binding protein